jgi:hypothetical protein
MFKYNDSKLADAVRKVRDITGKSFGDIVKGACKSIAERCVKFTPPKTKSQGAKAVEGDIRKLYVDKDSLNSWAKSRGNNKVAKRIGDLIDRDNLAGAQALFRNTPHLSALDVANFEPEQVERNRDSRGRVTVRRPRYFIFNKSDLKKFIKQKKDLVGLAKSAFVDWLIHFGGSAPAWIKRFSKGSVSDKTDSKIYPRAEMVADLSYLESLDERNHIIQRAIATTQKAMVTRARYEVKQAAKQAGLKTT